MVPFFEDVFTFPQQKNIAFMISISFFARPERKGSLFVCVLIIAMNTMIIYELLMLIALMHYLFMFLSLVNVNFVDCWSGVMGTTTEILKQGRQFNP